MKIGIDARFFGPRVGGGGLGRYVEELVRHLERLDHENEYVIFLRRENFDEYEPTAPNFKKMLAPWRWYTLAEQLGMPRVIRGAKLDLLHVPHFNIPIFSRVPLVVTIHDLILLEYPSIRATTLDPIRFWLKFIGYRFVISAAVHRARRVIAVSEATRQAILKRFPSLPPDRIAIVHPGYTTGLRGYPRAGFEAGAGMVRAEGERAEAETLSAPRWGARGKREGTAEPTSVYLLAVGNAYPHKNLDGLLRAFYDLNRPEIKLIMVGPRDSFRDRLRELARKLGITDRVIFTGFVDETILDRLYKDALAYIVPSFLEGFALPGLEAQSRGTPVLASDIPAHREVFGDSVHYFNPHDPFAIRRAILDLLEHPELATGLRAKGFGNFPRFNWLDTAQKIINIYKACTR